MKSKRKEKKTQINNVSNNQHLQQGSERKYRQIFFENIDKIFKKNRQIFQKISTIFLTNITWPIDFIFVIWP